MVMDQSCLSVQHFTCEACDLSDKEIEINSEQNDKGYLEFLGWKRDEFIDDYDIAYFQNKQNNHIYYAYRDKLRYLNASIPHHLNFEVFQDALTSSLEVDGVYTALWDVEELKVDIPPSYEFKSLFL